jgi:serine/threonine-protein kinase
MMGHGAWRAGSNAAAVLEDPKPTASGGLVIGSVLRDYRIITELGSGGMGVVYYAEHSVIGRRAAIKVLNPAVATNHEVVARFFTEAKAVNAIRHPNIVDVTDFGHEDNRYYIIMEFLEGETIGARLERIKRFAQAAAIEVFCQVCTAVGAAHSQGVVHRDLKTENIFLTNHPDYPDFVKVLDFGVVKLMSPPTGGPRWSMPGLAIGTPAYMSPEQCRGEATLDHRSDIYSFSVVAYEMLTGRLPFSGGIVEQMHAHLHDAPPPLRTYHPTISPELEAVVLRGLAKDPAERFSSIIEQREHFKAIAAGRPLPMLVLTRPEPTPTVVVSSPTVEEPPLPAPPPAPPPVAEVPAARRVPTEPAQLPPTTLAAPAPAPAREKTLLLPPPKVLPETVDRPAVSTEDQEARRVEAAEKEQSVRAADKLLEILVKRLQDNTLQLPSLPKVALKCLELLRNPDTKFSELVVVVQDDPLTSARILKVVNSALYGSRSRISTLEAATSRLGFNPLRTLLQELAAEEVFISPNPRIRDAFTGIWQHCLAVAHLARAVGNMLHGGVDPETAYLAGLVHDIGKPIVAVALLDVERSILADVGGKWVSPNVWLSTINRSHQQVGAAVAHKWNLPSEVSDAIEHLGQYVHKAGAGSCINLVRLANALAKREGFHVGDADLEGVEDVIGEGRKLLGITDGQEELLVQGLKTRMEAGVG